MWLVPVDGTQPTSIVIEEAPDGYAFPGSLVSGWGLDRLHAESEGRKETDISIMRKDGTDLRQITATPAQDQEFGD